MSCVEKIKFRIRHMMGHVCPKQLVSVLYKRAFGRKIDWKNPLTLNEKIQWLKFNTDTRIWTLLADKYRVREYVKERGCGDLLVDLYGVWKKTADIDWESLPDKFVMKTNNGCGDIMVCTDKTKINQKEWNQHFDRALAYRGGYQHGELHYNKIKPLIIAEELLDCSKQPLKCGSLIDYKIWCFNGEPHHILVCTNRKKDSLELAVYDLNWRYHPECSICTTHYCRPPVILPKPTSFNKMLRCAKNLSNGLPQVRVDFYEVGGLPYFGEMTMTSAAGFMDYYSHEFQLELGTLVDLSLNQQNSF